MSEVLAWLLMLTAFFCGLTIGIVAERERTRRFWERELDRLSKDDR